MNEQALDAGCQCSETRLNDLGGGQIRKECSNAAAAAAADGSEGCGTVVSCCSTWLLLLMLLMLLPPDVFERQSREVWQS